EESERTASPRRRDEGGAPRGRRRGGRGRGRSDESREPAPRRPEESPSAASGDDYDEPLDEDEASDEDDSHDVKHRNIPTWRDAVQSLVEANTENRRRHGDNRGG